MSNSNCVQIGENVIITNYKCGYSSLNLIPGRIGLSINEFNNLTYNKPVLFIYRNILTRNISLFVSLIINRFLNKNEEFIKKLLEEKMDKNEFKLFNEYLQTGKYIEAYKIFILNLDRIKYMDGHVHPQIYLLKNYNVNPTSIKFFNLDNKDDMIILSSIIAISFPYEEKIDIELKNSLSSFLNNNPLYKIKLIEIYKEDIHFFNKNQIPNII